jgi:hypothetical protein
MIRLADLAPCFSFVADKGFAQADAACDPLAFGNAFVLMAGQPFSLRIVRDRGQVFADIGTDGNVWDDLAAVLEYIHPSVPDDHIGAPPDLERLAGLLEQYWDKVVHLYRDPGALLQFRAFAKERRAGIDAKLWNT